jgi:hypothetical protein
MELYWLYSDSNSIEDLQGIGPCDEIFWTPLTWFSEKVEIEPFKLTSIITTQELEYFNQNWDNHVNRVKSYIDKLIDHIDLIFSDDYNLKYIKENRQDDWNSDKNLQQEYPDFDDYWEYLMQHEYPSDEIRCMMEAEWDDVKEHFEDVLNIFKKEDHNYLENKNKWIDWINQANIEIIKFVNDFTYNTPSEMISDFNYNYEDRYWKDWNNSEKQLYLKLLLGAKL